MVVDTLNVNIILLFNILFKVFVFYTQERLDRIYLLVIHYFFVLKKYIYPLYSLTLSGTTELFEKFTSVLLKVGLTYGKVTWR